MRFRRIHKFARGFAPFLIEMYLFVMVLPQPESSADSAPVSRASSRPAIEVVNHKSSLTSHPSSPGPEPSTINHVVRLLDRLLEPVMSLIGSPARADVTTIQPNPTDGKDALVAQMQGGTNYGSDAALAGGTGPDYGGQEKRSYLQFDLSSIPAGSTINTATLSLYVNNTAGGTQTAGTYKVTASWTETGVTWNNQPAVNGTAEATTDVVSTGWKSWTITSLVASWHNGTVTNNGVCVKQSSGAPPNNVRFHSSDYTTDATLRPKLVVDYTPGGGGPTAVTLNNPTNIQITQMTLTWSQNNDGNFQSYKLYRSATAGVTEASTLVATITTQTTTTYTNTGLNENTTYYYKVYVVNTSNQTAGSNEVSGTTQATPPTAVTLNNPTNIQTTQMTLTWSQNNDGNFQSYKLYRSATPGVTEASTLVTTITTQTTTTYTNTGLNSNTTYYYKVYVVNVANATAGSNEVSATTQQGGGPTAVTLNNPTNVQANQMNLSWSQNNDGNFQSYKLYRSATPGVTEQSTLVTTITAQATTSHTDTGLQPNTTYYYKVYVVNTQNQTAGSNEVSGTTLQGGGGGPTAVTLNNPTNVQTNQMDLSWSQNNDGNFQSYKLYRSTTAGVTEGSTLVTTITTRTTTTYTNTGLNANTTYYYKVYVVNTSNQTAGSNEVNATTLQEGAPPTAVTLNSPTDVQETCLSVSWSQNNDGDFSAYRVYRSITTPVNETSPLVATITTRTTTVWTDAIVSPGQAYYYRVYVKDTTNLTTGSNEVSATTPTVLPPNASTLSADTNSITSSGVILNWTANTDCDFERYELYRSRLSKPDHTDLRVAVYFTSSNTTFTDSQLRDNTNYYYRLYVYDKSGNRTECNQVQVATLVNQEPTAVTLSLTASGDSFAALAWTQNSEADFAEYRVYRSQSPNVSVTDFLVSVLPTRTSVSWTDNDLAYSTTYYYRIFTFDRQGGYKESNEMTVATTANQAPPGPTLNQPDPTPETGDITYYSVDLSWTLPTPYMGDFTRYEIRRAQAPGVTQNSLLVANLTSKAAASFTDNYLYPATTYYYRLYLIDRGGLISASNEITIQTLGANQIPPGAVTLYPLYNVTGTSIDLRWTQSTSGSFTQYKVYRSTTSPANEQSALVGTITDPAVTQYRDATCQPGTTYYYTVWVSNTQGLSTGSNEKSATTKGPTSQPPTVALLSPANGQSLSGTVPLQVQATDEEGIASVKVLLDEQVMTTLLATPYETRWNTLNSNSASSPAAGQHVMKVIAYDNGGVYTETQPINVTISNADAEPPVVNITAPKEYDDVKGQVLVLAEGSDNVGITRVKFYVDGQLRLDDTVKPFVYQWNTAGETDGTHTLKAEGFDAAQNFSECAPVTVRCVNGNDVTPPTVSITNPLNGATVDGLLTVKVNAVDNESGLLGVKFYIDGTPAGTREVTPPFEWPIDTFFLSNGSHSLTAEAFDFANNHTLSTPLSLTVNNAASDTTPPTAVITSPANNSQVLGNVVVTTSVVDNVGVAKVVFLAEEPSGSKNPFFPAVDKIMFVDTTAPYEWTWDSATRQGQTVKLYAVAYDATGNPSSRASVTVTVDANYRPEYNGPTVTWLTPSAGATVGGGSVKLEVDATDATEVKSVTYYLDPGPMPELEPGTLLGFRIAAPYLMLWDTIGTSSGSHTLRAKAKDRYGNVSTSDRTITVSVPPPTVSILSPVTSNPSPVVGGNPVPVQVSYSDTNGTGLPINRLELLVDSVLNKAVDLPNLRTQGTYTFELDATALSAGAHALSAKAYDNRNTTKDPNNYGESAAVNVTVDNITNLPPTAVVLDPPYNVTYNGVSLRWSKNIDTDFQKYEVHKSLTANFTPDAGTLVVAISNRSSLATLLSPLVTATTYYLKVVAVDTANQTTASNEVTATTPTDDNTTPNVNATIEMEYNLVDKVTSVRDWLGVTTATYDALNRDQSNTDVYGRTIQYEYDQNGSRSALVYHDGTRVEYTYDAANRLLNVKRGADILAAYQYDPAGNITRQDNLNGTYTVNAVDTRNRITNISHKKADQTLFLGLSYLYDSGGNRIREKESNGTYRDFFYDSKNQLTRETKRTMVGGEDTYGTPVDDTVVYDYSYTFDAVGNRLTYKDEVTQTTTAYTYNTMNQMLTAGNTTFGYDDNGNLTTKTTNLQTTNHTWDCFGKLVKLSNPDGSVVKFVYDGVGHRVKRWRSNGNETVFFVNDKSGDLVQLLSELDASGNQTARYVLGNTLLTMERGGVTYAYHFDALGATRAITDPTSAIANQYGYDAFGNFAAFGETTTNPYVFLGRFGCYNVPDTGLIHIRARYYVPGAGRFISLDPSKHAPNWYVYAYPNPVNWIDINGREYLFCVSWFVILPSIAVGFT